MAIITEEQHIEMLEKKADGSFMIKYPKIKSKSGVTFDEHLEDYMAHWHKVQTIEVTTDVAQIDITNLSNLNNIFIKADFVNAISNTTANYIRLKINDLSSSGDYSRFLHFMAVTYSTSIELGAISNTAPSNLRSYVFAIDNKYGFELSRPELPIDIFKWRNNSKVEKLSFYVDKTLVGKGTTIEVWRR